jgi:hypothetical protein
MPKRLFVPDELYFEHSPSTNKGATSFERVGRARNNKFRDETQMVGVYRGMSL